MLDLLATNDFFTASADLFSLNKAQLLGKAGGRLVGSREHQTEGTVRQVSNAALCCPEEGERRSREL